MKDLKHNYRLKYRITDLSALLNTSTSSSALLKIDRSGLWSDFDSVLSDKAR